ncbi:MAG: AAA family ATPase, partial [Acidimicrobiales bacterium]
MSFEPTFLNKPGGKYDPAGLPHPIPFVTRVRLSNYRSIRACDVVLGPLTVLVGPNGSGKSNFLDALAFLGEAVTMSPEQALESRGGLRGICSRVPGPTDRFAISVEAQIPWGPLPGQMPTARYGFELAANDAPGERPFVVKREVCRI